VKSIPLSMMYAVTLAPVALTEKPCVAGARLLTRSRPQNLPVPSIGGAPDGSRRLVETGTRSSRGSATVVSCSTRRTDGSARTFASWAPESGAAKPRTTVS
jgi:hypothetical protein